MIKSDKTREIISTIIMLFGIIFLILAPTSLREFLHGSNEGNTHFTTARYGGVIAQVLISFVEDKRKRRIGTIINILLMTGSYLLMALFYLT